jgi:hypothetical protein
MPDHVHQIGRVLAVVDGEGGIKSDPIGVFAQEPGADTMRVNLMFDHLSWER